MLNRAALLVAMSLAATTAGAQPFTLRAFDEWVVACDNIGRCSMLNMGPAAQARALAAPATSPARICIHQLPAPRRDQTIHVTTGSPGPSTGVHARYLRIAGPADTSPDIPLLRRSARDWQVPPRFVPEIISALLDGGQALLLAPGGQVMERIAIDGINDAMGVAGDWQQRHNIAALEGVLAAPLPPLPAGRTPSAQTLALGAAACGAAGPDAWTGHGLIGDRTRPDRMLWTMRCDMPNSAYFVIENQDGSSAPVPFAGRDQADAQDGMIPHAEFEPEVGLLREAWHATTPPPSGEACMVQRLWGWTGRSFERIWERRSLSCMGSGAVWLAVTYARPFAMPALGSVPPAASAFSTPCGALSP